MTLTLKNIKNYYDQHDRFTARSNSCCFFAVALTMSGSSGSALRLGARPWFRSRFWRSFSFLFGEVLETPFSFAYARRRCVSRAVAISLSKPATRGRAYDHKLNVEQQKICLFSRVGLEDPKRFTDVDVAVRQDQEFLML